MRAQLGLGEIGGAEQRTDAVYKDQQLGTLDCQGNWLVVEIPTVFPSPHCQTLGAHDSETRFSVRPSYAHGWRLSDIANSNAGASGPKVFVLEGASVQPLVGFGDCTRTAII